jgi:acetyl-CoA acetyltransferase
MGTSFRDRFAIVGVGVTPTAREGAGGRTKQQLEAWAVKLAIEDAGLRRDDIDGAVHGGSKSEADAYSRKLGLRANFFYSIGRQASGIAGLAFATHAVRTGNATHVAVSLSVALRSAGSPSGDVRDERFTLERDGGGLVDLGWSAGIADATSHALYASRHMHQFGTTHEHLGAVAIAQRTWANLNPLAVFSNERLTLEEYLASSLLVEPYRELDCAVDNEIGCALIVTSAEGARGLRRRPIYIKGIGFGEGAGKQWFAGSAFVETDARAARDAAFREARVDLADVDVTEIADAYTGEMVMLIEDYGFCEKGEGGDFVASGATMPGGTHPMNTHGGMLSGYQCADTGNLVEAVLQLRGDCGARQVQNAEIAMVDGHGWDLVLPYLGPVHGTAVLGATTD